ncbi:MAG: hypothetical protein ABGY71_09365 [bacterium]|jgi:hypothetical protein|nr:hypothetical protein [Planctomycetota bacterium]HIL52174.1 hypothetical protein [Planctomycetota bacterium]
MEYINTFLFKILVIFLATPLWWPIAKALWEELNEGLADDGGLLGRVPSVHEQAKIEERQLREEDRLVHETWLTPDERRMGRRLLGATNRHRMGSDVPGDASHPQWRKAGFR